MLFIQSIMLNENEENNVTMMTFWYNIMQQY